MISFLPDIHNIGISTNVPQYIIECTTVRLTCHFSGFVERIEIIKDGILFDQWRDLSQYALVTARFNASLKNTGKYRCKGAIGSKSRYSPPVSLIVGSKYMQR